MSWGRSGEWVTVQNLAVAVAAVSALIVTFALVGRAATGTEGIIAAAIVGAVPGFGLLSTSFMSDIPALALSTSSLLVGGSAPTGRLIAEYSYRTFAIVGHSLKFVYTVDPC